MIELVRTNFKLRYNNSVLGFLWVLIKPLMTFLVLYFVFSNFKGGWVENYQIYLLLGIIMYYFVNDGIVYGMKGLLQTAHIVLKVNFPREIALASAQIMATINFVVNLFILGLFVLFNPIDPTLVSVLYFISINLILFLCIYAISFFTSIILVKLRDLEHVMGLVMQLLFYATPIFYPAEALPELMRKLVFLNPLTILIQASRDALIYGEISYIKGVILITGLTCLLLLFGSIYFRKNVKQIAEKF
ncbi:MAG: ABC transporter permease [Candidatus Dojkabacteria bacterium]|nr:ABC transporter permease [Candidatus Dojkabacteria bacterium]